MCGLIRKIYNFVLDPPLPILIFGACMGIFGGFMGFFVLTFAFDNYNAGIWSLLSLTGPIPCLHFHLLYRKDSLHKIYSQRGFKIHIAIAVCWIIAGLAGAITYFTYSIVYKLPILPIESSFILAGIQAFMVAKWNTILIIMCRRYIGKLKNEYSMGEPQTVNTTAGVDNPGYASID